MSFCRWSSMNHSCDIYLYADAGGGYTCHVAKSRRVSDVPCPALPERFWERPTDEVSAILKAQEAWVQTTTLELIGLPHDGRSFYNYHRDEMVEVLKMLKAEGYRMPEDLIDVIASEEDEAK